VLEVAQGDGLALGVVGEPALAEAQQLVDLVVADVVVLAVVEHGDQHVEVREQFASGAVRASVDGVVAAVAPLGVGGSRGGARR
jgi:hypothetical protein